MILEALRGSQSEKPAQIPEVTADKILYTEVETDKNVLLNRFRITLEQLHGEFYLAESPEHAAKILNDLLVEFPDKTCLSNNFKLMSEILSKESALQKKIDNITSLSIESREFAAYHCSITHADFLIARTGSVVITSLSGGGRRLSVLPPVHIVLANRSQIVPSLENTWQNLEARPLACSSLTIITGPSRTSDIEKELVLGAHGPKRLVVIVVSDNNM
jgi:L-lactate dehydrogenase complex protein LldG